VGQPIRIGKETYDEGVSTFAPTLLEYSLSGQFERFSAKVGIDAVTGGKGSVIFEVHADSKQLWSSGPMTGLDDLKTVEVPVTEADRLRLVVTDGGDGNKFDLANWVEARLSTAPGEWESAKLSVLPPVASIQPVQKVGLPSGTVKPKAPVASTSVRLRHKGSRMLVSGDLVAEVMDPAAPDRYNVGTRFTPLAAVLRVNKAGKEYLFNPITHDPEGDHAGLASEFDLITPGGPPGFADAAENGSFIKVGVGALRKTGAQYMFWNKYPAVSLARTTVEWGTDSAHFRQSVPPTGGYGYSLSAKVTLKNDVIDIDWKLRNSGFKPLKTRQYTHNFFRFSEKDIGPGYAVSFPYAPQVEGLSDAQSLSGRAIQFAQPMSGALNANVPWPTGFGGSNAVTVSNTSTGQSIECITSLPGIKTAVHATQKNLCPEQFIELSLAPGQEKKWQRRYIFKSFSTRCLPKYFIPARGVFN